MSGEKAVFDELRYSAAWEHSHTVKRQRAFNRGAYLGIALGLVLGILLF